ncbi:MAG: hypothetical protein MJ159_04495 [Treponemataceae bacterium]|nr:hypothetical protein [Treponemataceae bacterium]
MSFFRYLLTFETTGKIGNGLKLPLCIFNITSFPHFDKKSCGFVKKLLVLFLIFICSFYVAAQEETVLVKKNEYGGKTVQFVYQNGDAYYSKLESSVYYFDADGKACRVIHKFNESQQLLKGFSAQEERLENGLVLSYKLTLTAKQRAEQGIDYLIEYVGENGSVIRKQYVKGELSRTEQTGGFTDIYPFYALDVLEKYLAEDETHEIVSEKAVYKFSATFSRGRSFVEFTSGLKNISEKEKNMISAYMDCYNQNHLAKLFNKKVQVSYGRRTYTAFVQDQLLSHIKKGKQCLLSYGVVGYNGELCLLVTAVGNLD